MIEILEAIHRDMVCALYVAVGFYIIMMVIFAWMLGDIKDALKKILHELYRRK